ncbi:MAG: CoA transferase [Deltaproteobacteria bacterium]|nr:CoA transferase [Deltaproteobacteria bacterium]
MHAFAREIETALDAASGVASDPVEVEVVGRGSLASCFDVTGLAVASIAAAGGELARYAASDEGAVGRVEVDRRLASMWFGFSLRPEGWALPSPWDPIAGDYPTRDGWIRLHTNAPHHRDAAIAVLGVEADRKAVAAAVARHESEGLEAALVEGRGCAAAMRTQAEWARHPQGEAVAREPLVAWATVPCATESRPDRSRSRGAPLAGVRVLDLTRVLAGPVATRFLASWGADVLRIDPPSWDEPAVVPEVTVGKRCAGLDLEQAGDRARFESLVAEADVFVHGYRPDALARLGYDSARIRALNPDLIDVALCAYGWTGPWRGRRGFDSLVQMSSGIAHAGSLWANAPRPTPLPVQALDHAAGYLMAAAVLRGLRLRRDAGLAASARLSLARTASLLTAGPPDTASGALAAEEPSDLAPGVEDTTWGAARRLRVPLRIAGLNGESGTPACALRSGPPAWRGGAVAAGV